MHFKRLRLTGFKSFVEPTELEIGEGLTGVVGPNGCGKSNLLEAFRWVMGETSYKKMRASAMDDVIFSGTKHRPARNMAEVSLLLDNPDNTAPGIYNKNDTIEISRRIEREVGSAYRINGKDVRAKDVQLFFADASTGSNSPSLVRQGRISEIINAKPQDRRKILEEAAGITGLHTRRHEAELRLKAAETNLTRLEDVTAHIEQQLSALKRQARQATRYKKLSGEIRKAEATKLHLLWSEASSSQEKEQIELNGLSKELAENTRAVSEQTRVQQQAEAGLPKLREEEAIAGAGLQRLQVEQENFEKEQARSEQRQTELQTRLEDFAKDILREKEIISEAEALIKELKSEEAELMDKGSNEEAIRTAQNTLSTSEAELGKAQEDVDGASQKLSAVRERKNALETALAVSEGKIARLKDQLSESEAKEKGLLEATDATREEEALKTAAIQGQETLANAEAEALKAEQLLVDMRAQESDLRAQLQDAKSKAQGLETEIRTLTKILSVSDGDLWPPVIDALKVQAGFEAALGAALGDDLDAPSDSAAPIHWDDLSDLEDAPDLPAGATALTQYVSGPKALTRRLSQIGLVEEEQGKKLQVALKPGQRLVSKSGALWRWDGFTASAEAQTSAAQRLAERNRLGDLIIESDAARETAKSLEAEFATITEKAQSLQKEEALQRQNWREAVKGQDSASQALQAYERLKSESNAEGIALKDTCERLRGEIEEETTRLATTRTEIEGLEPIDGLEAALGTLRETLNDKRDTYSEARAKHDGLSRDAQNKTARLETLKSQQQNWSGRIGTSRVQIENLETRHKSVKTELLELQRTPEVLEDKKRKLLDKIEEAEKRRNAASDDLSVGESKLNAENQKLKELEGALSLTRENRGRTEERLEASRLRCAEIGSRISQTLNCSAEEVFALTELSDPDKLPSLMDAERKLERLKAERERLGGVNLRAEEEMTELSEQLEELNRESEDLVEAIKKLRGGINSLNKEGRQRLLDAFDEVNEHFSKLFTTLFGGGRASLELVESDDPLEAGLEIMAQPPGKRTGVLSLLSGGEQTLTALSLMFAVFLTNPSPICVLDEVDAPLDDANVERFCNLLDEMIQISDTRFLIITHHALTLSRMNRLFGVTMAEQGVSQIVSVNLEEAEEYRDVG